MPIGLSHEPAKVGVDGKDEELDQVASIEWDGFRLDRL